MPPIADEPAFTPEELQRAWHLLRSVGAHFDHIARLQGWPTPFSPVRYLLLAHLTEATLYGLSVRRLRCALSLRPSTLAYHLDALEAAGLIARARWTIHDRRKVAVRLTDAGRYAVRRLSMSSPAIASP
jgi:DNA-binding MarR family transcriptional regulator